MPEKKIAPFARPLYVMLKPAGSNCNLSCEYCYYLEKNNLYKKESSRAFDMSLSLLEKFTRQYIQAQTQQRVMFTWHGGEPLLRSLSFYRKAVELQREYAAGHIIDNSIQTNGTLLTEDWCRFFKDNGWLVGLSVDGPRNLHNKYRPDRNGNPSFERVLRGIELLNKYEVEWNAMAVVNNYNVDYPKEFYDFFKGIDCRYIQFTPVVERIFSHEDGRNLASPAERGKLAPFSVSSEKWGYFLCSVFDEWVKTDVGDVFIQLFDSTLANWMGVQPGVCTLGKICGSAGVMEYNGDVYSCDHFVFPEYKLGNIYEKTISEMMYSDTQLNFGANKYRTLPNKCRECDYLFACNGECPKNRFIETETGEKGLNYFCEGYYKFFKHVAPYMDYMKTELLNDRAPSNVMKAVNRGEIV